MAIGSFNSSGLLRMMRDNTLHALIAANAAAFALVCAGNLFSHGAAAGALALPSSAVMLTRQPWSLFSYMFVHTDPLHLLFNMLWLYCFGRILQSVRGGRMLATTYAGGGVAGAVVFMSVYALAPSLGTASLMGSSAAVVAVAVAVAFIVPDMRLNLWLIGAVKIKWIVLVMVLVFCIGFTGSVASTAAHAGGALYGAIAPAFRKLRQRFPALRRPYGTPGHMNMQAELDSLLDKVKQSGYDALSQRDKRRLFELSHKIKQR